MSFSAFFPSLLGFLLFLLNSCNEEKVAPIKTKTEIRTDKAILAMYKIYAGCSTSILKIENRKVDTLQSNVSYLCLPVETIGPIIRTDTFTVCVFFRPENGVAIEDSRCNYAYDIIFLGDDDEPDFIGFEDNGYTLPLKDYFHRNKIELIFAKAISACNCIDKRLRKIIDAEK